MERGGRGRGSGRRGGYGGDGRGGRGCGGEGRGGRGYGGEVRGVGGFGGGRGRGTLSGGDHRWNNNRDGDGYVGSDRRDRYEYPIDQPRDSSRNNIGGHGDRYENREEQPRDWRRNQSGRGGVRGCGRNENWSSQGRDSRRNDGGGEGNRYSRGPDSNISVVSPEDPSSSRGGVETQPTELHQRVVPSPPAQARKGSSDSRVGVQMSKDWKQLSPLHRPDRGGSSSIRNVKLCINHFLVKYNPETVILHYDVDIKPEIPPKHGRSVKIPKSDLSMIRNKLFSNNPSEFPLSSTAYDGEKNIFSAVKLPIGKFRVEISEGEDTKTRAYIFTIKLVNELNLAKLNEYLRGCATSIPREILQGMDVVMRENPTREMISFGHNFYHKVPNPEDDLGHGISGFRGFQPSLKATSQGLSLCLDYSVLACRKRLPVLEFLRQHIDGFDLDEFGRFRRHVENALVGLKVYVNHRNTSQRFVVRGLTGQSARDSSFNLEDSDCKSPPRKVFLVEYFKEKYKKTILHDNLPCLDLGKNNKKNYVPMEFCELVEGQRFLKENLDRDSAQRFKEMSLPRPCIRQGMIRNMIQSRFGPCGGEIAQNFSMNVDNNMTSVEGRVIGPPELKLGAPNERSITVTVDKEKCQWNFVGKLVVQGKPIDRWAVLDFRQNDRGINRFDLDPNAFIPKLIARCDKLGIRMAQPLFYERTSMRKLSSVDNICEILEGISQRGHKTGGGRLQLLVCVMARRDPGYKYLKWISEMKIGIVTQCCLSSLANKANDQYLANLSMKINAKLGGSNVELNRVPISSGAGHVMFIWADVNHPTARNATIHSIAAVVGTLNWPAANHYAARVRAQPHRCERILDFGNMCLALIESYTRQNKVRPDSIIIFRDGVSDGQFDMVLNEEFLDLKRALATINYSPVITIVVAQKRHQTRLFPQTNRDSSSTGNVPPGTVVDTKIVHPFEFDFYLCSHYGSLGTSKPTHYHVLYDEHGFTSDQLQKLIFDMCFTMARCTKPVSLVPPVYYADLVAYRGRLYHEAMIDGQSPQSVGSSSSSLALLDERFFKLHPELEDEMFFI